MLKNNYFRKFDKYFLIYLLILAFCATIFLYSKHTVGNDTSISEWLINYEGGFTRRGIIGEICFNLAQFFDVNLRYVIFLFQTFVYLIYLFSIYLLFSKIKNNIVTIFAIFTPIFLLYPVAEVEALGRKEIFLYIYFLSFLFLINPDSKYKKYSNIYIVFITPIVCLIYEQIIHFFPFIVASLVFQRQVKNLKSFFKICLLFVPSILVITYFFIFPLSNENHLIMEKSLLDNFNEVCYMSCNLLNKNDLNKFGDLIKYIYGGNSSFEIFTWIIRYLIIITVGFFPLYFLSFHSKIKNENIFSFFKLNNVFFLILFLSLPIMPLYIFGGDWGRWTGMLITFSTIFYFYLYKFDYITVDFEKITKKLKFFNNRKKIVIFFFIIFAFGWNQKTLMKGDVATNPLWKVPYNTSKKIFGFNSFKLFQDSPIIIWHKKYLE
tara:strand:+ start:1495 stop:2799 length:1305 start_codon:yes stop_codon:yes gene_type:complete